MSAGADHLGGTVVYRKGELSKGTIDREWPHQVALRADRCTGHNYVTMRLYCDEEGLSLCIRGHSFRREDADMIVFCFATPKMNKANFNTPEAIQRLEPTIT